MKQNMTLLISRVITCVCFILLLNSASAQDTNLPERERAFAVESNDSIKWALAIDLHNDFFKIEPTKSFYYAEQLLEIANRINKPRLLYRAYAALSRCAQKKRDYAKIFPLDSLALVYATLSNDINDIFLASMTRANNLMDGEHFDESYKYLLKALELANNPYDIERQAKVNLSLGGLSGQIFEKRKGIEYLRKAVDGYTELNNQKLANKARVHQSEYLIDLCEVDEALTNLNEALKFYQEQTPKLYIESFAKSLKARIYLSNGNFVKAIEIFKSLLPVFKENNNFTDYGLVCLDIAGVYLSEKKIEESKKYILEARDNIEKNNYEPGFPLINITWAEYHSLKGDTTKANTYFKKARQQINKSENDKNRIVLNEKLAQHCYRNDKWLDGDIYWIEYATLQAKLVEQEELSCILNRMKTRNTQISNRAWFYIDMLYDKQGIRQLEKILKNGKLRELIPANTLAMLNPFTKADSSYQANADWIINKQMMELEQKYKTKEIEKNNELIQAQLSEATQKQRAEQYWKYGITTTLILVGVVALFLFLSRKRALREKQRVEKLEKEVHHNVKNNFSLMRSIIEETENSDQVKLPELKSRMEAIATMHSALYKLGESGQVDMQAYISKLAVSIQNIYEKNVALEINCQHVFSEKRALSIGTVLGELLTNSYKYAFNKMTENQAPKIAIHLNRSEGNGFKLHYSDNGQGYPDNKNELSGFGMDYIKTTLNSSLIKGKMTTYNREGANAEIEFKS